MTFAELVRKSWLRHTVTHDTTIRSIVSIQLHTRKIVWCDSRHDFQNQLVASDCLQPTCRVVCVTSFRWQQNFKMSSKNINVI